MGAEVEALYLQQQAGKLSPEAKEPFVDKDLAVDVDALKDAFAGAVGTQTCPTSLCLETGAAYVYLATSAAALTFKGSATLPPTRRLTCLCTRSTSAAGMPSTTSVP